MKDQVFFSLSLSFSTTLISKGSSSFALRLVFQYRAPFSLPRLHLRNTPSGNFALLPSIFTLRHADSPFVIRRGIRPRGISIGTSPISHVGDRDTRAMDKDVDRSPYLDNYIEGLTLYIYTWISLLSSYILADLPFEFHEWVRPLSGNMAGFKDGPIWSTKEKMELKLPPQWIWIAFFAFLLDGGISNSLSLDWTFFLALGVLQIGLEFLPFY